MGQKVLTAWTISEHDQYRVRCQNSGGFSGETGSATIGLAGGKFSYHLCEDCGNPPACSFRNKVAGTAGPQGRVGVAFLF